MTEHDKLREALENFGRSFRRGGCMDNVSRDDLECIFKAAKSTLPRTKMVEIKTWRVEWTSQLSDGSWDARCDYYVNKDYALRRYDDLIALERDSATLKCVRLSGPFTHQQEVPCD